MFCTRRRGGDRGQTFAEFAIVLPILLLLVFGVFDFGRAMSVNVTVTNSSREGARYIVPQATIVGTSAYESCRSGATPPSTTSGQGQAWRQLLNAAVDTSTVAMTVRFFNGTKDPTNPADVAAAPYYTCTSSGTVLSGNGISLYTPTTGDYVQFEVDAAYALATPLLSNYLSGRIVIAQTTTMVLE